MTSLARLYDRALGEGLPPRVGFEYPDLADQGEPEGRVLLAPQLRMTAQRAALLREWVCEDASEGALDAIDALSKETVALWHGHGLDPDKAIIKFDDALKSLYDCASRKGLPLSVNIEYLAPSDQNELERRVFLAPRLRMTAERAALLRDWFRTCKGPDKGGGRTLHEEEWGRPIWTLAISTYEIFEMLSIKPTSTPEGHYYRFSAKVHELVTGQEIGVTEKNKKSSRVGLKDAIAKAVTIYGRLGDLRNKQSRDFRQVGRLTAAEEEELRQLQTALRHGRSQGG